MSEHPLQEFFEQWSYTFTYNPSQPATSEFYRLCDIQDWDREDFERQEAFEEFRDALTKQFNCNYGTDVDSLDSWQLLCENLGIFPIPDNLEEARTRVKETHVNLVDLTDGYNGGREITIFPTEMALSIYTKKTGRFFPMHVALAGGVLRYLLRRIMNPPQPPQGTRGKRGRRGRGRGV